MADETKIAKAAQKATDKAPLGVVVDERGQDQPADKKAAQTAGKPTKDGQRAQEDAAKTIPIGPGQPAGGE